METHQCTSTLYLKLLNGSTLRFICFSILNIFHLLSKERQIGIKLLFKRLLLWGYWTGLGSLFRFISCHSWWNHFVNLLQFGLAWRLISRGVNFLRIHVLRVWPQFEWGGGGVGTDQLVISLLTCASLPKYSTTMLTIETPNKFVTIHCPSAYLAGVTRA